MFFARTCLCSKNVTIKKHVCTKKTCAKNVDEIDTKSLLSYLYSSECKVSTVQSVLYNLDWLSPLPRQWVPSRLCQPRSWNPLRWGASLRTQRPCRSRIASRRWPTKRSRGWHSWFHPSNILMRAFEKAWPFDEVINLFSI